MKTTIAWAREKAEELLFKHDWRRTDGSLLISVSSALAAVRLDGWREGREAALTACGSAEGDVDYAIHLIRSIPEPVGAPRPIPSMRNAMEYKRGHQDGVRAAITMLKDLQAKSVLKHSEYRVGSVTAEYHEAQSGAFDAALNALRAIPDPEGEA